MLYQTSDISDKILRPPFEVPEYQAILLLLFPTIWPSRRCHQYQLPWIEFVLLWHGDDSALFSDIPDNIPALRNIQIDSGEYWRYFEGSKFALDEAHNLFCTLQWLHQKGCGLAWHWQLV